VKQQLQEGDVTDISVELLIREGLKVLA